MKAKEGIIDLLNEILTENLTAINQYFVHSKMCENWGYERLHHHVWKRSLDEMKDADEIIEHTLYLEGVPNMQRMGTVHVGETVPEQLALDLKAEQAMLILYAKGVTHCTKVGDYTTRHMLEDMQKDTDGHIDWIETQLALIKQVGLEKYLSEQIHKEGS
jgi:bacterioferritin